MTHALMLTTAPDRAQAEALARGLVEQGLAACVQLLPIDSVYRWEGQVQSAAEVLLLIKTRAERVEAVTAALAAAHPYETPQIIAVPITAGLPAYLAWIDAATAD